MDIQTFVARSLGKWKSQRSAHHLAFSHFEEIRSTIMIAPLPIDDPKVSALCQRYNVSAEQIVSPFHMSWEGETDWDEDETVQGETVLVPVPNPDQSNTGKLLRDQGYAETIEAAGDYRFNEDGSFVLTTAYDRAAAEEKIWFTTDNLRFRVSLIKTSSGKGVTTASLSSEIRIGAHDDD